MDNLTCFKAYDIRGRLGEELNITVAYNIGRAYAEWLTPKKVAVGGDARQTSAALKGALIRGLNDGGVDVLDLGLAGSEEVYFAAFHLDIDGGIEVTASHNPIDFNGMKLVGKRAQPISSDNGLLDIKSLAERKPWQDDSYPSQDQTSQRGSTVNYDIVPALIQHYLGYIDTNNIIPLKVVVNSGNGAAGHIVDALELEFNRLAVPIEFIKVHHQPDSTFPNGIPNPLLPECREATSKAVVENQADFGVAWDGDFDRCFLFDETGQFIEGYYIVGLLAEMLLRHHPGEKIIHDPRLTWNTRDVIKRFSGIPLQSKTGHAFIKQAMRDENAIYGGEMSAHHYFRDFGYCDSGMIPWLMISELISVSGTALSQLVAKQISSYPSPGELNATVQEPDSVIDSLYNDYAADAVVIEWVDGLSMEFCNWRFNIRKSNTEPLLRLNLETKGNQKLMLEKTKELTKKINEYGLYK